MKIKILTLSVFLSSSVYASNTLHVYGPGGPAPAMLETAKLFEKQEGIKVNVVFGPQSKWEESAKNNADLIFSGSEIMLHQQNKSFSLSKSEALYLRPSGIIVRKGNPKSITGIETLIKSNLNILVVNGAGQSGLWEDIVGRSGNVTDINEFKENIVYAADNSAQAIEFWETNPEVDAWVIWSNWYDRVSSTSDLVAIEKDYMIYRPVSISYTDKGMGKKESLRFVEYLSSSTASEIFLKYGWQKQW
ncbi:substrate-binding domain-containing protein [Vibrio crassostreae]|uniref:substrate-binding domain-containing protein n=1 Tax=Vibrio crassostreae TaxID=246167 RepID=UPI001A23E401|nr:solute-binding protein [Vibrio vulnificus]MEC7308061.1 substrate-binding domain-containing protein [Vibrio crassostreae]